MNFKWIGLCVWFCFSFVTIDTKYTVYSSELKPVKIDVSKKLYTVLVGKVSCHDCVKNLAIQFSDSIQIVTIIEKSKYSAQKELSHLRKLGMDSTHVFFQFSKKNDFYGVAKKNKLFRLLKTPEFPQILVPISNGFEIVSYLDFLKLKRLRE